jgi:Leucine-rich repeat (LRR) protein
MRQNQISRINFPPNVAASLTELDLYDNLISHIKGLEDFHNLTSLDLSFNKIKHIKNVSHLKKLTEIFFVQNKISRIEGLEELTGIKNLELGANKIRVRTTLYPHTRRTTEKLTRGPFRKSKTWTR